MLIKIPLNIWDIKFNNIVTSELVKKESNSKYFIGYLDKAIRSSILIKPKMSGIVKTMKVKDGDKDRINKLMN